VGISAGDIMIEVWCVFDVTYGDAVLLAIFKTKHDAEVFAQSRTKETIVEKWEVI
jgi:hypothetical protein